MTDITYHKVQTQDEIDACMAIRSAVFIDEQQVPAELEIDGEDENAMHYLALQGETPVATARIRFKEEGAIGKIERMAVLASHRGLKIGQGLMTFMLDDLEQQSIGQAILEAQTHAQRFYENLGFEAEGEEFEDAGMPHITMRKSLRPELEM